MADDDDFEVIIPGDRAALIEGFLFGSRAEAIAVAIGASEVGDEVAVHSAHCRTADPGGECSCTPDVIVVREKASA